MKFFSVSILALSLVSQVVAEPIPISSINSRAVIERANNPLESIATIVSDVLCVVVADLESVAAVIEKDAINDIAPAVTHTLEGVAAAIKTAADNISTALASIALPLAKNEYETLVTVLKALNTLISGVESEIENIVKSLSAEVKPHVVNEVTTVLNVLSPLAKPVAEFGLKVAGGLSDDQEFADQLKALATSVETVLGALLDPVGNVLKELSS